MLKIMDDNKKIEISSDFLGEFIGTFILVFFGCGSLAATILFNANESLFQVAAIWGITVTLAIYSTRNISNAHLNPAISFAMVSSGRMDYKQLPAYLLGQFWGAFLAAVILYFLFDSSIENFEVLKGITRGAPESLKTAKIFGNYYNNPFTKQGISTLNAFFAEFAGTFALIFFIMSLTKSSNVGRPEDKITPILVGLSVALVINIIGPLTRAGLNPARDLSPRILAYIAGWKDAAMPDKHYGFLTVYVLGPILGGMVAGYVFHTFMEPVILKKHQSSLED